MMQYKQKTATLEDFQKEIEKAGFAIVTPEARDSFQILDPTPVFEEKIRSLGYSVDESQLGLVGDKKITITVEDPHLGSVYNFTLYLSPQTFQNDSGYQEFKSAAITKCLNYNVNIIDLEFRRLDGRQIQISTNFWEDLSDDEMFLAIAKASS